MGTGVVNMNQFMSEGFLMVLGGVVMAIAVIALLYLFISTTDTGVPYAVQFVTGIFKR